MAQGMAVPFLPPTIQQTATGGSSASAPSTGNIGGLEPDLLMKVLAQLKPPEVEPVERPSVSQRIMASLSDALMAYAQGIQGRAPVGGGATAGLQQREEASKQRQRQAKEAGRQEQNQAVLTVANEQMRASERAASQKAIDDRSAASAAAVAERQAMDDQRRDHEKALEGWIDWMAQPEARQYVSGLKEDLSKLSMERLANLKQAWLAQNGESENAGPLAALDQLRFLMQSPEVDSATVPLPGGGNVTGRKESAKASESPDSPVSDATARAAARFGVVTTGMTEAQANEAVAKHQEQVRAEREKRLAQRTERGTAARDDIAMMITIQENAKLALQMLERRDIGGPVEGNLPDVAIGLKDYIAGTKDMADRIEFNQRMTRAASSIRKAMSGLNLTVQEAKLLEPMIPDITDIYTKKKTNLRGIAEEAERILRDRMKRFGLTEEDIADLRNVSAPVPSPLPPGARIISGGPK